MKSQLHGYTLLEFNSLPRWARDTMLAMEEKINQLTIIVLSEYPAKDERFIQATKIRSQIGLPKYK